ncbi:hypothetical protein M9Y10_001467 [Tritrichomonas musculus]|uniref:Uncharacterized protein n=1 Tax=Tritrichomonas musculus TaxID=1915356 RepID=A0ABR2LA69_9EUKA
MSAEALTQKYVTQMKSIQESLLDFLESDDEQSDLKKTINLLTEQNIRSNKQIFKSFLYLLLKISKNYHHSASFYPKIDQIFTQIKDDIKKNFSNSEIFRIFKSHKRILLYLLENNIIIPDKSIALAISSPKYYKRFYPQFFYPEFEPFFTATILQKMKNQNPDIFEMEIETFKEKRRIGENDSYICQLIRDDSVVEFVTFVTEKMFHFLE